MSTLARQPNQAIPRSTNRRSGELLTIAVDLDPIVADLLGRPITVGPLGSLLGETRGPHAIAAALRRALSVEAGE